MHAKPDLRVFTNNETNRSGSVITAVILLEFQMNEPRRHAAVRNLAIIAGLAFVGGIAGSILLSPFVRMSPSDPVGKSVSTGLGGLAGVAIGLVVCAAINRRENP